MRMELMVPPVVMDLLRHWTGRSLRFSGRPTSWSEAQRMSSGYAADNILDRVTAATRAVVSGEARFERDSVLLDEPDYPFALLTMLWRAAASGGGRLDVVDFGGSLGSSYRQCRPLLDKLEQLRWRVIEQPGFVAVGRQEFTTSELGFFESPDELPPSDGERVILMSSVLQYLEDPYAILDRLNRLPARHMLIDRTPISDQTTDRLCIQKVPKHIYPASYPCRLLSRQRLLQHLSKDWQVICDYASPEGKRRTDDGLAFEYRGLMLERISS